MSKKKAAANKGKGKGGTKEEDDDWDLILNAEVAANQVLLSETKPPAEEPAANATSKSDIAAKEAENDDDDDNDDADGDGDGGTGNKKDKKKKKKKTKKEEVKPAPSTSGGPMTAAGKAILLRQQLIAEEEARVKRLQEEAEQKAREEDARLEAEERAIEEEKERKRKQKQDKVDAQKAAGTYMTKAEKEKAKKAQAKLESLKKAGLISGGTSKPAAVPNKKLPPADESSSSVVTEPPVKETAAVAAVAVPPPPPPAAVAEEAAEEVPDEWDLEDDWEANIAQITSKVGSLKVKMSEDVEDMLMVEEKQSHERLKQLGLDRAKREEDARIKREVEEKERQEMERKEFELVMRKEISRKARLEREASARAARTPNNLRSPISCIMFSRETLAWQTNSMQALQPFEILLPGLLVIDTPGHESFANLRSRGSSLCDIAVLVIDLMHGLEPQTIESLNLLKKKKTPFVVALNKVDRCYGWKTMPDSPIQVALAAQDENCRLEFKSRADFAILQLNEQGLNAKLYWDNDDLAHTVSLVPTSAVSGEGVPDLLKMVITLTQTRLTEQLMFMDVLQCTVLEVKVIEGLGHTVDVVLVNGTLREGDSIVVSTMDGPVVTTIRALLTPPPNREMRVKSEYVHHASLQGAIGVKIVAPDIGRAVAGTPVMVIREDLGDDVEDVKSDVQEDLDKLLKSLQTDSKGVMVHASTLGALEALLQFLRVDCKPVAIPVSHISIGPIHKKDVMRANIMNEKKIPEFATILAFDVSIDADAQTMADELNVRIFSAEIIYHLFDQFSAYMNGIREARKNEAQALVVFPTVLKILPQYIFNKKDPIVIGVEVLEGTLRLNTMMSIPSIGLDVGRITRIENNHKEATSAKKGTQVSVRIVNESNPTLTYGRQFDHTHTLYSKISRASIDACKEYFKDEMTKDDWALIVKLKKVFNIS
eukprot:gene21994-30226_t